MGIISIVLIAISLISFYIGFKLRAIFLNNTKEKSNFMQNEARRILLNNCEIDDNYSSQGRVYMRGMSLIKSDNGKYKLISQAKVCDIGLY